MLRFFGSSVVFFLFFGLIGGGCGVVSLTPGNLLFGFGDESGASPLVTLTRLVQCGQTTSVPNISGMTPNGPVQRGHLKMDGSEPLTGCWVPDWAGAVEALSAADEGCDDSGASCLGIATTL